MADHVPDWALKKIHEARQQNLDTLELDYDDVKYPRGRQLKVIPDEVFMLRQLKTLSLKSNQITKIPPAIKNLTNLEELDFSFNVVNALPEEMESLVNLSFLGMIYNQISELPQWTKKLTHLTRLNIGRNQIKELPSWISDRKNWIELGLSGFNFGELPEWIRHNNDLLRLELSANNLDRLPPWIKELKTLNKLRMDENHFSSIPEEIFHLEKLSHLSLQDMDIPEIPEQIEKLNQLFFLDLSGNLLNTLPHEMTHLTELTLLYLGNNQFETIPDLIFEMKSLRYLYFDNEEYKKNKNQISTVPERILNLQDLYKFNIAGNPVQTPPYEIVQQGIAAIQEYYRQKTEQGVDHLYEAKMLVLGEGGAGKTTLAKKIQNPDYQLKDEDSTKGIEVTPWSFRLPDGKDFRVNIWDFGGQEIYHATHQFFLTRRSLYALVADSRKEDTDFNYWLQVVELLSDGSPVLIIKNEKQNRAKEINERELRGRFGGIQQILATNLADNRGLLDVIKAIQYYIADLPHVGASLPKYWVRVREALEKDPHNYISLDTFFEICVQCGFTEEKDMLQLSGYLHDLGVFLHFQDDPVLRNTVILKPRWGTDAVYRVLDDETVRRNKGTFTRADLVKIWSDKGYVRKQYELLQLMMKFRLAYKVPDSEDTYIAPHLLDPNQPEYPWDVADNLYLRYSYEFMPKGILTQFIVLMHEHIREHNCVWKTGVVLEKDGALTEVIEDYDHKEIRVRVAGKNKKALLDIVDFQMEGIHKSYHQLRYDTLIPCRCDACKTSDEPWFYPLARLKQRIIDGQLTIECQKKPYHVVSVSDLLFDIPFGRLEEERRERGGSHMMPDVPGVQEVHYHYGPEEHYDTGGGAVVKGNVDTGGGAFAGRDQITIQTAFDELRAKAAAITDEDTREDLESTLDKLEREAGKGDAANENRIKGYFNFLAEMAPDIWEMVVKTFINPIAGVSTMFQKVAQRAKEELKK